MTARSVSGSTTTTAMSAMLSAPWASWENSTEPGQSTKVHWSSR